MNDLNHEFEAYSSEKINGGGGYQSCDQQHAILCRDFIVASCTVEMCNRLLDFKVENDLICTSFPHQICINWLKQTWSHITITHSGAPIYMCKLVQTNDTQGNHSRLQIRQFGLLLLGERVLLYFNERPQMWMKAMAV